MTSYRDLAIAAMDNHRLAYWMAQNALEHCQAEAFLYWQEVAYQAQRELHVYLNWMIHHPKRAEGGQ